MPTGVDTPLDGERRIGRIPIRNLWLLMLYASDLTRYRGRFDGLVEDDLDNLPNLVARLLANEVERRHRRNLTRGYRHRDAALTRVRGRIDLLTTEARQLLLKGEVFCRFEELTIDTPRNRLIRAALDFIARLLPNDKELTNRCRLLAGDLGRSGVGGVCPSRAQMAADRIGRNDSDDGFMVALAQLAFDLALPTEEAGSTRLADPDREEVWARRLFEKAVFGFARVELMPLGWSARAMHLEWQVLFASEGLSKILPRMETDIVLDPPDAGRRLVIDTKFTSIVARGRYRDESLKSGYLYQMYAYLRSQEGVNPRWDEAAGLLLHPAIDASVYEHALIQNHPITFATIDLSRPPAAIRAELRHLLLKHTEENLQNRGRRLSEASQLIAQP